MLKISNTSSAILLVFLSVLSFAVTVESLHAKSEASATLYPDFLIWTLCRKSRLLLPCYVFKCKLLKQNQNYVHSSSEEKPLSPHERTFFDRCMRRSTEFSPSFFLIRSRAEPRFGGREVRLWQSDPRRWILSSFSS